MEDNFHLGIKALIRNHEGKFLLLKVNPAKLKGHSGEPYWDIPGGRVQKGHSVKATLFREVEEETGISDLGKVENIGMLLSKIRIPIDDGSVGLILSIYTCEFSNASQVRLSDEHTEASWFSSLEASHLLRHKYPKEFTNIVKDMR